MSALDTAKEIARMTSTASLGKDVIDLLKEKVALLTEQITTLEAENSNVKKKVADLEQELDRLRPKKELHQDAVRFLKLLFDQPRLSLPQIVNALNISRGMVEYHRDKLWKAKMIGYGRGVSYGRAMETYVLLPKGREYVAKYLLKK